MKSIKRIISFILSVAFIVSAVTIMPVNVKTVNAATTYTQSDVESKLKTLMNTYVGTRWTSYYYGSQCKGFANLMFYKIFGVTYIGAYNSTKYYIPNPSGATAVGKLNFDQMSKSAAKTLLSKGMPGDFIQVRRRGKSWGHSMILVSTSSTGIKVFDCNSDGNCGVKSYSVTWDQFYNKNSAMSLYRANSYVATPATPTISSCTADSSTKITVKWDSVSGAEKYEVFMRKKGDDSYTSLTSSCTSTSYTAKNLKAGTVYYFKVRAINDAGKSDKSDFYCKSTLLGTPAAPTVVTDSDTQLTITWSKVTNAKKYKIERRRGDESKYTEIKTVTGTSYTDTGLKPNSKYWYRITAAAEVSEGAEDKCKTKTVYSDVSEVGHKWTAYSRPSNTVDADNTDRLTLSWKKSYGGSSYSYKIYRKDYSTSNPIATTTSTSYTDKGLTPGVVYQYKIETVVKDTGDHCVSSGWFYATSKVTKAISLTPASSSSVKIEWSKLTGGSGLIYRVGRRTSSTSDYEFITSTTGTSYTDTGLTAGKEYTYYVQVRDSSDNYMTSTKAKSVTITVPTGVTLNKTSAEVTEGSTISLSATIAPTNTNVSNTLTWSSGNTSVATVTSKGVVTAISAGTAVITVKTANGKTASCTVTVNAAVCSHTYGEWTVDTEATCETDGVKSRTCTKCGETETDIISAAGHSYGEWIVEAEATCIEEGSKYRECSVCGETETEIIAALSETGEHSFGEWITETKASCISEGSEYRECSVCGETEINVIEATDHDYVLTEQIDPTLDGPGSRTYTCSDCGDSYTESYTIVVEEGIVEVGSAAPIPGEAFTVPVTISENPGIAGFSFTINYDGNVMQPTSITAGELITGGTFSSNLEQGIPAENLDVVGMAWSDLANITDAGTLFYITFETVNTAPSGEYEISLEYNQGDIGSIADGYFEAVMPDVLSGTVTIADIIRGDVNLDRIVNSFDIIYLTRYLSHWSLTLTDDQTEAADVYKDGMLNIMDTMRLSQILAGYTTSGDTSEASTASLDAVSALTTNVKSLNGNSNSDNQITVESVDGIAGEYVYVPVTIENNLGAAAFSLTVDYDRSCLTPVSITAGDIISDGQFVSNMEENEDASDLDYITAVWNNSENMTEDGTLFTLVFLIGENAAVGQELAVEINYDESMVCSQDLKEVDVSVVQGAVEISELTDDEADEDYNMNVYYINGAYITQDGEEYSEALLPNGDFNLQLEMECTYEESVAATIIVAEYDSEGRLIDTVFEDITDTVSDEGVYEVYIGQTETEIDKIKAYTWDSPSGMVPLSDVIEIS